VQNFIYNSVPFHLPHDCSSSGQQLPIAVATYFTLASVAAGEIGGPRPAHYNQDSSTPSHVQLSGPRASSLKPSLKSFSSDLLVRPSGPTFGSDLWSDLLIHSCLAERKTILSRSKRRRRTRKGSTRTAVLCSFPQLQQLSRPLLPTQVLLVVQFPEQFHSADALGTMHILRKSLVHCFSCKFIVCLASDFWIIEMRRLVHMTSPFSTPHPQLGQYLGVLRFLAEKLPGPGHSKLRIILFPEVWIIAGNYIPKQTTASRVHDEYKMTSATIFCACLKFWLQGPRGNPRARVSRGNPCKGGSRKPKCIT
jgi:hypothetical protein